MYFEIYFSCEFFAEFPCKERLLSSSKGRRIASADLEDSDKSGGQNSQLYASKCLIPGL